MAQGARQLREEAVGGDGHGGHGRQPTAAPPGDWSRQHSDDDEDFDIEHQQPAIRHQQRGTIYRRRTGTSGEQVLPL